MKFAISISQFLIAKNWDYLQFCQLLVFTCSFDATFFEEITFGEDRLGVKLNFELVSLWIFCSPYCRWDKNWIDYNNKINVLSTCFYVCITSNSFMITIYCNFVPLWAFLQGAVMPKVQQSLDDLFYLCWAWVHCFCWWYLNVGYPTLARWSHYEISFGSFSYHHEYL